MKDANNPFSGDMMLLPDDTEIKALFQEQEILEDDYERKVSSMDLKARNQIGSSNSEKCESLREKAIFPDW